MRLISFQMPAGTSQLSWTADQDYDIASFWAIGDIVISADPAVRSTDFSAPSVPQVTEDWALYNVFTTDLGLRINSGQKLYCSSGGGSSVSAQILVRPADIVHS